MTLNQYIQHLGKLLKDCPEAKDYQVVTSSDDEGNSFNPVNFRPGTGNYDGGEFSSDGDPINAVCLN